MMFHGGNFWLWNLGLQLDHYCNVASNGNYRHNRRYDYISIQFRRIIISSINDRLTIARNYTIIWLFGSLWEQNLKSICIYTVKEARFLDNYRIRMEWN